MWNGSKEIRVGNSVGQRRGVCPIADCQHVEMLGEWSYWLCFIGAGRTYQRGIKTSIYSICNLLNQVLQYFKRNQKQSVIYYLKLQQWVPFCHSGHIWWTPSWQRPPYTGCWCRGSIINKVLLFNHWRKSIQLSIRAIFCKLKPIVVGFNFIFTDDILFNRH